MADIADAGVVLPGPEEGRDDEALAPAEDVLGGRLPLALGYDPVLDADPLASERIRPARDVACGEHAGRAGLEILVHEDAGVDLEPRRLRDVGHRPHADPDDDEIGIDCLAILQRNPPVVDGSERLPEMEAHALPLV